MKPNMKRDYRYIYLRNNKGSVFSKVGWESIKYDFFIFLRCWFFPIMQLIWVSIIFILQIVFLLSKSSDNLEDILPSLMENYGLEFTEPYFTPREWNLIVENLEKDSIFIEVLPSEIELKNLILATPVIQEEHHNHCETEYYDPFEDGYDDTFRVNIAKNRAAFEHNSGLEYSAFSLDDKLFIVGSENSIFSVDLLQTLRDLSTEIKEDIDRSGNRVITLTINAEVANAASDANLPNSEGSLFSNLTEARARMDALYEGELAQIRTRPVIFTPSDIDIITAEYDNSPRSSNFSLTVLDVTPSDENHSFGFDQQTAQLLADFEWERQMRVDWRERIQILFSNQNPDMEPLPSWSEVPGQPDLSDALAAERWASDNEVRKAWAARLNGGYLQTNIVIRESPYDDLEQARDDTQYSIDSTDDYYNLEWFNQGYHDIPVSYDIDYDIFEDEDLGLVRLFDD